jgi:hypothetical protein
MLVTEDEGFAAAAAALANDDLTLIRASVEEAITVATGDDPDVLAIDTDSVRDARPLIGALSLVTRAVIVAVSHRGWPGSEPAGMWRAAGADAVLPKPSGRAAPTLAGTDRDAYARWFTDFAAARREGRA